MFLVDTHTHIEGEDFASEIQELIGRAGEAGVKVIINAAFDMQSSLAALDLAKREAAVYACMGFHPCDSAKFDEGAEAALEALFFENGGHEGKIKAIGEIGLDYHYDDTDKEKQHQVLEAQVKLAKKLDLPIVIHSRDADQDTYELLERFGAFEQGVLMHCYSGSAEMAKRYVKKGALLGIGGVLTFKNARKLVEVCEQVPLEHLVFETDAPYLAPVPFRGKRNEPAYIAYTAEKLAEIKGISVEEVAEQTTKNALRFYRLEQLLEQEQA
ncbi:MAG: TatD family hydrolase [Bacillota bacterium]|nr:TatD family hydrolase [Bacillota bacterium]